MFKKWLARRSGQIYSYNDGIRTRYADPIDLWHSLFDSGKFDMAGNLADLYEPAAPSEVKSEAFFAITDFAVEAMGLTRINPVTGQGLSRDDVLIVVLNFVEWVERLKKKRDDSQTKWLPSAHPKDSPANSEPDSFSKQTESNSDEPTSSPRESSEPLEPSDPIGLMQ